MSGLEAVNSALGLGSGYSRYPGETNLENSLSRFAWLVSRDVTGNTGQGWDPSFSPYYGQVSDSILIELDQQVAQLYFLIGHVPAWSSFTAAQRVNISAQTGVWLQNLIPGPDYSQDTVLLVDPATTTYQGECADPGAESSSEPCEVEFQSDCFTISMPSNRGVNAWNWSRTFGCEDYFYGVERAVDQISQTVAQIESEAGAHTDGGVGIAEIGEAVLDEVVTTKDAVGDEGGEVVIPWFVFAGAAIIGLLAWRGARV